MLSITCKYAVRAVIYISVFSSSQKRVGIREISSALDIPYPFLAKILQSLTKHKILASVKGPNGGFSLARSAGDISLMDIVEIVDGTDVFTSCLIRTSKCSDEEPCALHENVTEIRSHLKKMFVNQTISDMAAEFKRGNQKIKI